jgi:IS30 family transposase
LASHLTLPERRIVAAMLQRKISVAQIAVQLGRHCSTIHREIRRNFWHDDEVPMATGYWHMNAQHLAASRRKRQTKLLQDNDLRDGVIAGLKAGWSPQQIAGRLRLECGRPRVCHETIYRYVYSPEGQAQELGRHLPERRRKRKARYARKPRSLVFPERCMIRNRPQAVKDRQVFGHWEADLMIFRKEHGPANVATVVERMSRYTVIFRNNDRRSRPLMNRLIDLLSPLPRDARQSLTFDRGLEFVSWRELEKGLGAQAWFCDPQAPWQKPTVENTNRRVRRWLPRDTILLTIDPKEFGGLAQRMNATPRKCLGYRTPAEVFREELARASGLQ